MSSLFEELMKPDPMIEAARNRGLHLLQAQENERQKYLADPANVEKILSHWAHQSLPESKGAKIALGSPLDKIEKAIPEDDPRKRLASSVYADAPMIIRSSSEHPAAALSKEYLRRLQDLNKNDALNEFIFDRESSLTSGKVAAIPGYEEYKRQRLAKHEAETPFIRNPITNFLWGAVPQAALEGIGAATGWKGASSWAGKFLSKIPHPAARIAGVGLMAIPAMMAGEALSYPIRSSQWGAANPVKAALTEGATVIGSYAGIERGLASLLKSAEKGAVTAVDDAFRGLAQDPSLKNLMGFNDKVQEVNKGIAKTITAIPRAEFWAADDLAKVSILQQRGMSLEDATKEVAFDVMKRQTAFDSELAAKNQARKLAEADELSSATSFSNRVSSLQKMFPDEPMDSIIQRASKAPGIIEESIVDLQKRGFSMDDIQSMTRPVLLRTALGLGQGRRPLEKLAEVEHFVSTRKSAQELEDQFQQNLWKGYNNLTETFKKENLGVVKNMLPEELIAHREQAQEFLRKGIITDDEYRRFDKIYKLANAPDTEKELFNAVGPKLRSLGWQDSAISHLEMARDTGDYGKWNSIIEHFFENTDRIADKKAFDMFRLRLNKFTNDPKVAEMYAKEGLDTARSFNRIVYGSTESEMRTGIKQDIRSMMDQGLPADTIKSNIESKWGNNWSKFASVGAIAGLGMYTLGEILGPGQAEAAGLDTIARISPKMLRSFSGQKGTATLAEAAEEMVKKGYAYPKLAADGFSVERPQRFWGVTPDLDDVARMDRIRYVQRIMTPGAQAQILFKDWASPQPQAAYITTMAHNNANVMLQAVNNILKEVPGYQRATKEVQKAMDPFVAKYTNMISETSWLENAIKQIDDAFVGKYKSDGKVNFLTHINNLAKKGKLDKAEEEQLYELLGKQMEYEKMLGGYKDAIKNYHADWEAIVKPLAAKHSSTRIALALEDVGMKEGDAWLAPLLTDAEKLAVQRIKGINDQLASMMIEVGEKPILAQEFIHHASHPGVNYKEAMKAIEKFTPDSLTGIDMAHFHHRAPWSRQLMPDIHYIMERYLPDANMRVGMADFWNTWGPFKIMADQRGYTGISQYLGDLQKGFRNTDQWGTINKWAQRIQMFEVARYIAMSPSVALKHAFKVLANVANYGFRNAISNLPRDLGAFVRNVKMDLGDAPKSAIDAVMKGHINTQRVYALANDMAMYGLPKRAVDRYLERFNDTAGIMLNNAERFDRGTSFLNAMTMATKQGMTPEQASYLVMDAVLKNNFLSGIHNPAWLRDPKTRLLFLFQGTPFKLLEQRMITAARGGGAVADAAKETLVQLGNLKKDIVEGTQLFKAHLIKDALMNPRDLAGNSYAAQLLRNILVIGATIESGKYFFDSDMWGMFHVPFVKTREQSIDLALNPMAQAAYGAYKNQDEEAFWLTDFLKKWLTSGSGDKLYFGPAGAQKAYRLTHNDIPEIYRDSKLRYLFAIPAIKED